MIRGLSASSMVVVEAAGEDDLAEVITETRRDDAGVYYTVCIEGRENTTRRIVWSDAVVFGHTDATVAGGSAFVHMAREQERIAAEVWAYAHSRRV